MDRVDSGAFRVHIRGAILFGPADQYYSFYSRVRMVGGGEVACSMSDCRLLSLLYIQQGDVDRYYKKCVANPLTIEKISDGGLKRVSSPFHFSEARKKRLQF